MTRDSTISFAGGCSDGPPVVAPTETPVSLEPAAEPATEVAPEVDLAAGRFVTQHGILCDDLVTIKWCGIEEDCRNRLDHDRSRLVWIGPATEYDPMPDERRRWAEFDAAESVTS